MLVGSLLTIGIYTYVENRNLPQEYTKSLERLETSVEAYVNAEALKESAPHLSRALRARAIIDSLRATGKREDLILSNHFGKFFYDISTSDIERLEALEDKLESFLDPK